MDNTYGSLAGDKFTAESELNEKIRLLVVKLSATKLATPAIFLKQVVWVRTGHGRTAFLFGVVVSFADSETLHK
jgi:hypothetical protein